MFQDTWYEFRVLAVMQDLISEPSNVAGVSSTGKGCCFLFPPRAWRPWDRFCCLQLVLCPGGAAATQQRVGSTGFVFLPENPGCELG